MKILTNAQLAWMFQRGFAWEDPANNGGLGDIFWTRKGGYQWNVAMQKWEMVF